VWGRKAIALTFLTTELDGVFKETYLKFVPRNEQRASSKPPETKNE
jgi:hypothetical protein